MADLLRLINFIDKEFISEIIGLAKGRLYSDPSILFIPKQFEAFLEKVEV